MKSGVWSRRFRRLLVALVFCALMFGVYQRHHVQDAPPETAQGTSVPGVTVALAQRIFPAATQTELCGQDKAGLTIVKNESGQPLGMVVSTSPSMNIINGYNGPTPVLVGFDREGKIIALELLDHYETPRFVQRIIDAGYLKNWLGLGLEEAKTAEFDIVTSATMTSVAIAESIKGRLAQITADPACVTREAPYFDPLDGMSMAAMMLFVASLVMTVFARVLQRHHLFVPLRYAVLFGSVAVLGFGSATMLSMSRLEGIARSGSLPTNIALVILIAIAFIVPLISGRNIYCRFICPFGALQVLLWRLSPWRHKVRRKPLTSLQWVRVVLLVSVGFSVLIGKGLMPDMQEPFSAFRWQVAGVIPMALAGGALLIALLGVNRPWCTYCCSTGALLNLLCGKWRRQRWSNHFTSQGGRVSCQPQNSLRE